MREEDTPDRYPEAVQLVRRVPYCAGESLLQRRLRVTYAEAEVLLARMERDGYVAAKCVDGRYREVLAWKE